MERSGKGFDTVDESWTGAYHDGVGIDRPHRSASGHSIENRRPLCHCTVEVVSAWRDDDVIRIGGCDFVPRRRDRLLARARQNWAATCGDDQVGNPMTAEKGRISPFEDEDLRERTVETRDPLCDHVEPGTQRCHQCTTSFGHACGLGNRENRIDDLVKGLRVDLENFGAASESRDGLVDVSARHGADAAQVLTENQIRVTAGESVFVERVQIIAGGESRPNECVDLIGLQMFGVHATDDDFASDAGVSWEVALECDPEEILLKSEIEDDLRRRRKETHDAHLVTVGPACSRI